MADSESSSVRLVDLSTGATKAVVGAEKDPTVSVLWHFLLLYNVHT